MEPVYAFFDVFCQLQWIMNWKTFDDHIKKIDIKVAKCMNFTNVTQKSFIETKKSLKGKNIEISAIWEKAKEKRLQRIRLKAIFSKKRFRRLRVRWVGSFEFFHDSEKSKCGTEWKRTRNSAKSLSEKKTEARNYTDGNRQANINRFFCEFSQCQSN